MNNHVSFWCDEIPPSISYEFFMTNIFALRLEFHYGFGVVSHFFFFLVSGILGLSKVVT